MDGVRRSVTSHRQTEENCRDSDMWRNLVWVKEEHFTVDKFLDEEMKIKGPRSLIKRHALKMYWELKIYIHAFLTSTLSEVINFTRQPLYSQV
jgi:hypothetical protein